MVNEDADSRPISVSELLARHQGDADTTTSAKDSRNRRRAGRDGAVSMAELTGEVPRVSSEPTAEPRHISFPRADRPGDRLPPAGGALTSSGMPSYAPATSSPQSRAYAGSGDADNEATGVIDRVQGSAPETIGPPETTASDTAGPDTTASETTASDTTASDTTASDTTGTDSAQDEDFDSYRSFSDVEVEPEVKQPRRGLFGRLKGRGETQRPPAEADGPTEAIAKTFDRTEPVDTVQPNERTDIIDRTGTDDVPSPAELTDRTEVIERTDAPDTPDTAGTADTPGTGDLPDDLERTGIIDRSDDPERTGVIERTGFGPGAPDTPADRGGNGQQDPGAPSAYLANLYPGASAADESAAVESAAVESAGDDDLRPGETTEVIAPIGGDAPAAAARPAGAYRIDTPEAPRDDAPPAAVADTDLPDDDDEPGTVTHEVVDRDDEPEIDPATRAAQARAARAGAARTGAGRKKLFGRKSGTADDGWPDADGTDRFGADEPAGARARDLAADDFATDDLVADDLPADESAADDSGEPAASAAKTLAEKTSAAKKSAQNKSGKQKREKPDTTGAGTDTGHERSPALAWALVVAESILGIAIGIGLFWGFKRLWEWNVPFALVLSVVVIFSIVTITHVVRRSRDLATTLLAVGVGLLVTIGPLVLLAKS